MSLSTDTDFSIYTYIYFSDGVNNKLLNDRNLSKTHMLDMAWLVCSFFIIPQSAQNGKCQGY